MKTTCLGKSLRSGILGLVVLVAAVCLAVFAPVRNAVATEGTGYQTFETDPGKFEQICADESGAYTDEQKALVGCKEKRTAGGVANFVINIVISLLEVGAVAAIIYGGFTYTSSRGDPSKIAKGKQIIMYAVIGMAIGVLAFAIVNFVIGEIG